MRCFTKTTTKLAWLVCVLSCMTTVVAGVCTKQCLKADSTKCPPEAQCLEMFWMEMSPYVYRDENGTISGMIIDIFKKLLQHCCADCAEILETAPRNFSEFQHPPNNSLLVLPFKLNIPRKADYNGCIPIVKEPSSIYIKKRQNWKAASKRILSTIFDAWPVICIALLLSFLSGILIWILETWFNADQFPQKFVKGSWEGFWWAFVSMTTVGYGDRAPSSFLGRSFAIFWIVIGVCICSVFTATLTSAITNSHVEDDKTMNMVKVGVIYGSMETIVGLRNRAELISYNTTEELWKSLINDQVEGILLDSYYTMTSEADQIMTTNKLKIANVIENKDWSYGALVPNQQLSDCMNKLYNIDYTQRFAAAVASEQKLNHNIVRKTEAEIPPLFDSESDLFKVILVACGGCAICIAVLGVCWDQLGSRLRDQRVRERSTDPAPVSRELRKVQEMEEAIISEVQSVFTSWKNKMAEENGKIAPGPL